MLILEYTYHHTATANIAKYKQLYTHYYHLPIITCIATEIIIIAIAFPHDQDGAIHPHKQHTLQ